MLMMRKIASTTVIQLKRGIRMEIVTILKKTMPKKMKTEQK